MSIAKKLSAQGNDLLSCSACLTLDKHFNRMPAPKSFNMSCHRMPPINLFAGVDVLDSSAENADLNPNGHIWMN